MINKYLYVSNNAEIGDKVEIGPFCVIEEGVKIGDYTKIESFVHIKKGTIIGKNCHIHSGSILGDIPQDLGFKNEESSLIIGDNVVIRENCVLHRATGDGKATVIGDNCYLMAYVHVAHNVKIGNHVIVANGTQFAGYVEVEDRAFVSGLVAVHQFTRIGRYAMVGGSTKLVKDVLPFALCDGNPAKIYGINIVGLRRNDFSSERIRLIKNLFHLIYNKNIPFEERLKILSEKSEEEAKILYNFIKNTKRGITDASWRSEE